VSQKSVAIVGYGAVGRGIHTLFPNAVIYDEPLGIGKREEVNQCEYAFVSVPTPMGPDGECNISIVEEVVSWIDARYIILRSTVEIGTTDRLREQLGKSVVFQPEYGPAETPDHPFNDLRKIRWVILGGAREDTIKVADLYKTTFNADISIHQTEARTAELTKYMENCFLALKVTFCNEFYDIANRVGVDYNEMRELWLLDPRIGRTHSFVMPDARGFGGKCLPKDLAAMIHTSEQNDYYPTLLAGMQRANEQMRSVAKEAEAAQSNGSKELVGAAANGNGGTNGNGNGGRQHVEP